MTAHDFPPQMYSGTPDGAYAPPPMEAEALFIHTCSLLRDAPARSHDPGPAPWHRETPRDWFRVSTRAA